jgi:hypothetical protein
LIDARVTRTAFAIPFASQRRFNALFLAGFQVKRVPFDFLDDVFLQDFALKSPERVVQRFAILKTDLGQRKSPRFLE